jgi:hypothetical protein
MIFSPGSIAFHIFSSYFPATSATELNQILTEHKSIPLRATLDGATPALQELIREATAPDLLLRTETASNFLAGLGLVEEVLTRPPQESRADRSKRSSVICPARSPDKKVSRWRGLARWRFLSFLPPRH